MANNISPSKIIHYISQRKRILVGRNNQPNQQLLKFDYRLTDTYNFQVVNQINQIVSLSGSYKLYGSYIDNKQNLHILFDATSEPIGADNVLTFNVDTYTSQFMNFVKNQKQIDVSIVQMEGEIATEMTLRDIAIAYPRPYIEGVTPREIVQRVILSFNNPVSGAFAAGDQFENVAYDINTFALGTGLDTITKNQLVIGSYNQQDPDAAFIIGNGTTDDRKNIFTVDLSGNVQAGAISATEIFVEGSNYKDTVDQQFAATSTWVTDTFETKESSTQTFNELENDIDQISSFVSGLPTDIATKANQTDLEVLSTTVEGLAETKADLSSVWTKENVYPAWQTDQLIEAATSGKADKSELADYATKQWVEDKGYITGVNLDPYATKNDLTLTAAILENKIPTKVSDLANDVGYTTGYTAGTGISISNQNVISIDGQLGKTYYADDTTLQLNENNNTFSVKSIRTKLNNGPGISLTEDGNGVVTISNTGGSTSGGGYVYTNGEGLTLSAVTSAEYQFAVDQAWFNQHIDAYTSGLQNYSAGSGISIDEQNVISVTGMVTTDQIVNMATTGWVTDYCSSFITESAIEGLATESDLQIVSAAIPTDYLVQDDLSSYVTSAALTGELYNYVLKTDLPNDIVTSGDITGFITSGWLEENGYATSGDLNDLSTTLSSALTSNVEALSTAIDTKTTAQQVTGLITGYVAQNLSAVSQLVNDTGFITLSSLNDYAQLSDIPVVTDFVTEDELSATSAAIVNLIPEVSGKADLSAVESLSTNLSTAIDLKANSADVYTKTEVDTALGNKVDTSALSDYYTKTEVNTITGTLEGEITGKVAQSDFNSLCTAFSGAIDGKTTSSEVKDQIEAYNYVTETALGTALSEYTKTSELNIPTSTSQLTNNSDFITSAQVDTKIASSSAAIINGLATESYVGTQIANTSANIIDGLAKTSDLPTKTSDLENDSDFVTYDEVGSIVEGYDYATESYVGTAIEDLSGVISTDYALTSTLSSVSGTLSAAIPLSTSQLTNDAGYITSYVNTTYTSGNLISISGENNSINFTGTIPTNEDISGIASAVTTGYLEDYDTSSEVTQKINQAIAEIPGATEYTAGSGLSRTLVGNKYEFSLTGTILSGSDTITISSNEISLTDASNYVKAGDNVSRLTNDAGYLTAHQSLADYTPLSTFEDISGAVVTISGDYVKNADIADFITGITLTFDSDQVTGSSFTFGDKFVFTQDEISINVDGIIDSYGIVTTGDLAEYAQLSDIPTATINALTGNVQYLSGAITGVANDLSSNYLKTADYNEYTDSDVATYLTTNDYVTSSIVSTALSATSAAIKADIPTAATDLSDYNTLALKSELPTVPTKVSELTNDVPYLSTITSAQVTGALGFTPVSTDTTYTAGTGLELEGTTFKLTAEIPSIEGLATTGYVTGAINDVVTGQINPLTGRVDILENAGYQTATGVSNIITTDVNSSYVSNLGFATTGEVYTASTTLANLIPASVTQLDDYTTLALKSEVPATASAAASAVITGTNIVSGIVSGVTSTYIEDYITTSGLTSGTGISINANNEITLNLSAATNGNIEVTTVDGVVYLSAASGGGGGTTYTAGSGIVIENGTIATNLSAGDNVTFDVDNQTNVVTINATGGGGGISNLSGGPGIKISQVGDVTLISIATAVIVAPASETFNFDFRNGSETSSVFYLEGTTATNVNATISGTLPNCVTTATVPSGISFTALSATSGANTTANVNVIFDSLDAYNSVTVPVTISTIGYVSASVTATSATYTFDGSVATQTFTFNYSYDGSDPNIGVQISGDLPVGITMTSSYNSATGSGSITFTGVAEDYTSVAATTLEVSFNAIDINPTTVDIDITLINVETPVTDDTPITFQNVGSQSTQIRIKQTGSPSAVTTYYSTNGGQSWNSYTIGNNITLQPNATVAFSGTTEVWGRSWDNTYQFDCTTGVLKAYGNILSLVNKNDTKAYTFYGLFANMSGLIDAKKVILPHNNDVTYSDGHTQFMDMFWNCKSLTAAPPIHLLDANPWMNIFGSCTSLQKAPQLDFISGTALRIFAGCTNLNYVEIKFTEWITRENHPWVEGVQTVSGIFIKPPALPTRFGVAYIPNNWTVLNRDSNGDLWNTDANGNSTTPYVG